MKIKAGDEVIVIAGKDKGVRGTVLSVLPERDRVVVEGATILPVRDVLTLASIRPRAKMTAIDLYDVRQRLLTQPFVRSAVVNRLYPGTVTIRIEERKPIGLLSGGQIRYIDAEGMVLPYVNSAVTVDIPAISNIDGMQDAPVGKVFAAKEMTEAQQQATAAMYDAEARAADIVITTALIPGRPAPRLLNAETVAGMKPGSVIVDMAAANGGNVEGTVSGEKTVTSNKVTIIGYTDLASRLAGQTSQLYGTNVVNLFKLLTPEKDGNVVLNFDDVVQRGMTVAKDGELLWPPPPVQVSAAPAAAAAAPVAKPEPKPKNPKVALYRAALGAILFGVMAAYSPSQLLGHFTVFALAIFVGYYVISNVAHALHTPLMAETNAISGIILVGGILQIGNSNPLVTGLALVAVLVASINIFGGFLVTLRMLEMFRKD